MCVLHFLRLLLGFQSALDDLLLTFSAARPYILVIIRLRMGGSPTASIILHI